MIRCDWFSILCASVALAMSHAQALAQPEDSESIEAAAEAIDPGDDSWTGLLDISRYTFRDLTLYWDNDSTILNLVDDSDRYYTNANSIELSFDPHLSSALAERFASSDQWDNPRFGVGIAIEQRIYSPADISLPNPPARDHPYAGHLALALSFQRADDDTHDHFEIDLGIVGHASVGETFQKWIHNTFPEEQNPRGWQTQLPTEPTANFTFTRTWKSEQANIVGFEVEMLPSLGFDVGTVLISARSSMTIRLGKNLPSDFGPASFLGHKDHTVRSSQSTESPWSIYAYTRLGVDAIARDMFLDGTAFSGSRSAQREPFVGTFTFGGLARYKSFYLGWSQNIQTERFELQPSRQTWGAVFIGCSFDW